MVGVLFLLFPGIPCTRDLVKETWQAWIDLAFISEALKSGNLAQGSQDLAGTFDARVHNNKNAYKVN